MIRTRRKVNSQVINSYLEQELSHTNFALKSCIDIERTNLADDVVKSLLPITCMGESESTKIITMEITTTYVVLSRGLVSSSSRSASI